MTIDGQSDRDPAGGHVDARALGEADRVAKSGEFVILDPSGSGKRTLPSSIGAIDILTGGSAIAGQEAVEN